MSPETHKVVHLFDHIAPVYDTLNRIISWGRDQTWRRNLAERMDLEPDQHILDISAGTGDMEAALKSICQTVYVTGLDPSRHMLDLYRAKIATASLTQGIAESIPMPNETVARVVCAFGLRNFQNREAAFKEIYRVLKPGGLWGFLEMSAPSGAIFSRMYGFYFKQIVPLIGKIISPLPYAYRYLRDSVYQFPDVAVMTSEHQQFGFSLVQYQPILHGAVGLYIFKKNDQV